MKSSRKPTIPRPVIRTEHEQAATRGPAQEHEVRGDVAQQRRRDDDRPAHGRACRAWCGGWSARRRGSAGRSRGPEEPGSRPACPAATGPATTSAATRTLLTRAPRTSVRTASSGVGHPLTARRACDALTSTTSPGADLRRAAARAAASASGTRCARPDHARRRRRRPSCDRRGAAPTATSSLDADGARPAGRRRVVLVRGRAPRARASRRAPPRCAGGPPAEPATSAMSAARIGLGVGVVGVVDDDHAVGPRRATSIRRGCAAPRRSALRPSPSEVAGRARARRRRPPRALLARGARRAAAAAPRPLPARVAQPERSGRPGRRARTSVARTSRVGEPERDHAGGGAGAPSPRPARSSALSTATPSAGSAPDQLALRARDRLAGAELAEVGAADVEHHRDAGAARSGAG